MMRTQARRVLLLFALMAGLVAGTAAAAQDAATPAPGEAAPHPAHIHSGTCEELGDVVHGLEDVTGEALSGTPEATPQPANEGLPGDVLGRSRTVVDASLDDLLAEPHAVNVHKSADEIGVFVACANIEGDEGSDELILDLQELNDSGITGQVILSDLGDGTTEVTITLTDAAAEGFATPEATPAS